MLQEVSFTYIELFKDNSIKSSGSSGRLPVGDVNLEFENTTLVQKIKMVLGLFDWKNISLFKKIVFPDLEKGTYLIKVFKENPIRSNERKYIGFAIVDLEKDTSIRIICRPQIEMFFSIVDEVNKGVNEVEFRLVVKDVIISNSYSDEDGRVFLQKRKRYYDVILLDAIKSFYSIPFHLVTKEAVQLMYDRLNADGALFVCHRVAGFFVDSQ